MKQTILFPLSGITIIVVAATASLLTIVSSNSEAIRSGPSIKLLNNEEMVSVVGMDQVCSFCLATETCTDPNPPNYDCEPVVSFLPPGATCGKDKFYQYKTAEVEDYCSPSVAIGSKCNVLKLDGCVTYDVYSCVQTTTERNGIPVAVRCEADAEESLHIGTEKRGQYGVDDGTSTPCGS